MKLNRNVRLKVLLWNFGVTQYELARRTGIPESYISKFINGGMVPTEEHKGKIAIALSVNKNEIF